MSREMRSEMTHLQVRMEDISNDTSSSPRSCCAAKQIMEVQHGGGYGCGELQVSVSFGRFDKDSLSWEKWSDFSPNKDLEEVDKCSTPGSVARKAAYFEAHYKRIAARKDELLLLTSSSSSDDVATSSREVLEEGNHSLRKQQQQQEEEEEEQNGDDLITLEKERLSFEVVVGETIAGRVTDHCRRSDEEKKDEGGSVKDDLKVEEEEEEEEISSVSGSDEVDATERSGNDIIHLEEAADCEFTSANVETGNAVQVEMSVKIREDTEKLESWRKPHQMDPLHKEKIMEKAKKKPQSIGFKANAHAIFLSRTKQTCV